MREVKVLEKDKTIYFVCPECNEKNILAGSFKPESTEEWKNSRVICNKCNEHLLLI